MNAVDQEFILILIMWGVGLIALTIGLVVLVRKAVQSAKRKNANRLDSDPPREG